jgi:hypothetical protein
VPVVGQVYTIDRTRPTVTAFSSTNSSGAVNTGDTVVVTFSEPVAPASIPTSGTLTLDRGASGNTTFDITGITAGPQGIGSTGFVAKKDTIVYPVTIALSAGNTVATVTVSGACTSCGVTGAGAAGAFTFTPNASITDVAGNAVTGTFAVASRMLF